MAVRLDSNPHFPRATTKSGGASAPTSPPSPSSVPGDELKIRAGGGGGQDTYTVVPGDYLIKIAGDQLGDTKRWHEIYDLNRDQISNPDLIFPGQVLRMPPSSAPAAVPSAPGSNPPGFHFNVPGAQVPAPSPGSNPLPSPGRNPGGSPPRTRLPSLPGGLFGDGISSGLREGGVIVKNYQYFHSAPGLARGFMDNPWGNTRFGTISGTVTQAGSKVVGFLKHNVATAAIFSAVSNGLDFLRGKESGKQALEGFGADTAAYAGIGAASTAIGAAAGSVLGPLGTLGGMLVGSVAGIGMGWIYEKFARRSVMNALGNLFGR